MLSFAGPSLNLGKFAGIPVKIHWSFSLLILFVSYMAMSNGIPKEDLLWFYSYVVLLFVFVIMHEYGHALSARRYGIQTRDIIISPIGGIARLEQMPEDPRQELIIAIAGPLVNVALALLFLIVQLVTSDFIFPLGDEINFGSIHDFIGYLLMINIVLVVFNMVPAFPMDGGRVLRALLTMMTRNRLKATRMAVWIGQTIAAGFLVGGIIWDQYMLIFIGIFVFITARSEYSQMKLLDRMNKSVVLDVMREHFTLLRPEDPISSALAYKEEKNFLVSHNGNTIIGALPDQFIRQALKNDQTHLLIGDRMTRSFGAISDKMPLSRAFKILNDSGWAIAEVIDQHGNKKGVIDRQLLIDFMRS